MNQYITGLTIKKLREKKFGKIDKYIDNNYADKHLVNRLMVK